STFPSAWGEKPGSVYFSAGCTFAGIVIGGGKVLRPRFSHVPTRQVVVAAHLDQARGGALELLHQLAVGVEPFRFGGGAEQQVHAAVVELVDQVHEAACGVVVAPVEQRHA